MAGDSDSKLLSFWNGTPIAVTLLIIAAATTFWALASPPLPGISVAVLGAVAAIMSLRPDMKPLEKAAWCLVVGCLLMAEIRAIRKDRKDGDETQKALRNEQNGRFNDIARGLTTNITNNQNQFATTLNELNSTLSALREVLRQSTLAARNTAPHAELSFTTLSGREPNTPLNLLHQGPIHTSVWYRNSGNEDATDSVLAFHYYTGKLADQADQERIAKDFESGWKRFSQSLGVVHPSKQDAFSNFFQTFSNEDLQQLDRGQTIYFVVRLRYTDPTGTWYSDTCEIFQEPERELNASKPCSVLNSKRYKIASSGKGEVNHQLSPISKR